jgi:aspartate aminotransferase-like enzyme
MSAELALPARLLMGAGPTNPDPRVLRAMASGLVGQFDPVFTALMADAQDCLRQVFGTRNRATFPVPGTSRAGMEAAVVSIVEPGERVVVVENGRFGLLFEDIARRAGGDVTVVRAPWGEPVDPADVERSLHAAPAAAVLIVHAETSTGVMNPVRDVGAAAHRHGALVIVDAVCSFSGALLDTDAWGLDVVAAGTQKCLGCPSGLAPITYSDAVAARMARRRTPIRSNYLDLTQIDRYWSPERLNHHTAPTTMVYGLREALRIVLEEGLTPRIARHRAAGDAMAAGLAALGLELYGQPSGPTKMPMLAPMRVPDGVDDAAFRSQLLEAHGIEIMGAFGPLAGRIWRIGTMAGNAQPAAVARTLGAVADVLGARARGALRDALLAAERCFDVHARAAAT